MLVRRCGDQHCQVGRIDLATEEILDWLDSFHNEERGESNAVFTQ